MSSFFFSIFFWEGVCVSVLALLTSRRNTLPSTQHVRPHAPALPVRPHGWRRWWRESGIQEGGGSRGIWETETGRSPAYLHPTERSSDSPSWYGSLKFPCWGSFGGGGGFSVRWQLNDLFAFFLTNSPYYCITNSTDLSVALCWYLCGQYVQVTTE